MRHCILLVLLCAVSVCCAAEPVVGTLTFEKSEAVVFRFPGGKTRYDGEIPGIKVLGRSQLSKVEGDKVNGIPMHIIELTSGDRITLVQGKPAAVTRTTSGKTVEWSVVNK
jgi:hypothetical protein